MIMAKKARVKAQIEFVSKPKLDQSRDWIAAKLIQFSVESLISLSTELVDGRFVLAVDVILTDISNQNNLFSEMKTYFNSALIKSGITKAVIHKHDCLNWEPAKGDCRSSSYQEVLIESVI